MMADEIDVEVVPASETVIQVVTDRALEPEVQQRRGDLLTQAKTLVIRNDQDRVMANDLAAAAARLEKEIKDHHRDMIKAGNAAHEAALAAQKRALSPVLEAKLILKRALEEDRALQRRLAQEEEEKRRKAEEEAAFIAALDAARETDHAKANGDEPPVETMPVFTPPPPPPPAPPKLENVSFRPDIEVEVLDQQLVFKAIAEGRLPIDVAEIKVTRIKAVVKTLGNLFDAAACGVRVTEIERSSVRV
jgi:hypothetical protein